MEVRLRIFGGCPHWRTMHERLREALRVEGIASVEPILELVETPEDAERLRFIGSPTLLVQGRDPFDDYTKDDVWRVHSDGSGLERVTHDSSGPLSGPTWIDTRRLAYIEYAEEGQYIVMVDAETGDELRRSALPPL